MNKKGFTVIELVASFSLAAIIITLLFSVVLNIKDIYSSSAIKTELLINQANLSKKMNSIIKDDNIISFTNCTLEDTEVCYEFNDKEGKTHKLLIDTDENKISFNNYAYKLDSNSYIDNIEVNVETILEVSESYNNSFLYIKIPIKNKYLEDENFGINLVYPFNSSVLTNINI